MRSPPIWLSLVGISAGVALTLALGISPWSLVIVAAVLACPIAMYFGMRGMGMPQESERAPRPSQAAGSDLGRTPQAGDRQRSTPSQEEKPHT